MPALKKDEDATSQKVSGQKDISFLQRLRLIKRKWLFIGGGVLLLLLVGIMANLSSSTSSDNFLPNIILFPSILNLILFLNSFEFFQCFPRL